MNQFISDITPESNDKTMRKKAGRRGYEFENSMQEYRKWFTTGSKKTQNRNAIKLREYCKWIGKTPEQLINEYAEARKDVTTYNQWKRETRKRILEFYNWLLKPIHEIDGKQNQAYKINTARTKPLGILAFYSANCETVKDVTKEFDAVQIPENEYAFTQDDLRKMFYYADTEDKALLSLAVSLGYSAIDFLELQAQKIKDLVAEAKDKHLDFIQFIGKSRAKTSIQPRSHLTPEAIDSLNDYLQLLEKKHGKLPKYLWASNGGDAHLTNQGLNKKLKTLVEKANIHTFGKQVKFHCIRKFLYTRLAHKDRDIAKVITGKKVNVSDLTYEQGLDAECERIFRETYKEISLNGDITGKTKREQSETIERLETRIKELETFNRLLQQFYTEDIVKRATEQLKLKKITYEQYDRIIEKLTQQLKA